MPKKIFIYEDKHSAYLSIPDLKELLTTTEIFSCAPDISIGSFHFNTDGLINPLFVVPGGATAAMGALVVPQLSAITANMGEKFDYLGICAGGFHATDTAELSSAKFDVDRHQAVQIPKWFASLEYNLKFFPDYISLGAFYPNFSRFGLFTHKNFVPYRVRLSLSGTERKLDQLYIAGPAFVPNDSKDEDKSEVIATYSEKDGRHYLCTPNSQFSFFESPAAIISRRASATRGARLISGTHIETCVKGSKLLGACEKDSSIALALPEEDYKKLIDQQEETQKEVVSLLRRTFNP